MTKFFLAMMIVMMVVMVVMMMMTMMTLTFFRPVRRARVKESDGGEPILVKTWILK